MTVPETVIWSAMAGVLVTLIAVAVADACRQRTPASVRVALFVLMAASSSVVMSGLPEWLWREHLSLNLLPVKVALGPLSGALALSYLVRWSGLSAQDTLVRATQQQGATGLVLATMGLIVWVALDAQPTAVLFFSGLLNAAAVVMGALVVARCVSLGDRAARWMLGACACLAILVPGLFARAMGLLEHPLWCGLTALATVGYFLLSLGLTTHRNRQYARLRLQAHGSMPKLVGGGLPRGVQLVEQVDAALWRSERMGRPCVVAAVVVLNLYAYGERAPSDNGYDAEVNILLTLAARIRQVLGFRNVLGLHHQRCFVLAVSAVQDPVRSELMVGQLLQALRMAVPLGPHPLQLPFEPDLAVGIVHVTPGGPATDAMSVMNLAEQLALEAMGQPGRVVQATPGARPTVPQGLPEMALDTLPGALAA